MPRFDYNNIDFEKEEDQVDFDYDDIDFEKGPVIPPEEPPSEPSIYERLKGYLTPERVEIAPRDILQERLERPTREPETMMGLPGGGVMPEIRPEEYPSKAKLIRDTAKALIKVPSAIAGSLMLVPGAGIRAAIELIPTISTDPSKIVEFGKISNAAKIFEEIMSVPTSLITTEEEAKAVENIGLAMKPIEMSGEGWRLIGEAANKGLQKLGLKDTYIEPLLATYGEAAAVFALPGVVKRIKNSVAFRRMSIRNRELVIQSLTEAVQKNPNMTAGKIVRTFDNPQWRKEALRKYVAPEERVAPVKPTEPIITPEPEAPITKKPVTRVAKEVKAAIKEEVKPSPLERLRQREREIAEGKIDFEEPVTVEPELAPEVAKKVPTIEEVPKEVTLYRGERVGQEGANYYSPDKEWARQFTQSGQDKEISSITISKDKIYRPDKLPKAYGLDDADIALIQEAGEKGFKAIWMDEGKGQPESVFIIDKKMVKPKPKEVGKLTPEELAKKEAEFAAIQERGEAKVEAPPLKEPGGIPNFTERQKINRTDATSEAYKWAKDATKEEYEALKKEHAKEGERLQQLSDELAKLPKGPERLKLAGTKSPREFERSFKGEAIEAYEAIHGLRDVGDKKAGIEKALGIKLPEVKAKAEVVREKLIPSPPTVGKPLRAIPKELEPLAEEARKYKDFDSFYAAISEIAKKYPIEYQTKGIITSKLNKAGFDSYGEFWEAAKIKLEPIKKIPTRKEGQQKQDTVELFSGVPFHRVDKIILDPLRKTYQKYIGNPLWNFLSETLPLKAGKKSRIVDRINKGLIFDYRKDPEFVGLRDETQLKIQQYRQKAKELADTMAKFPRAEQIRIAQVIKGGITATPGRYEAALETIKRFEGLTKDLQDLGILGPDNRFRQLSRKEIAKKFREIADLDKQIARFKARLVPTKKVPKHIMARARPSLLKDIKKLTDKRTDILERIRLHYKMSGKLYLRRAYEKVEAEKKFMNRLLNTLRIRKPRLKKGYDIRRKDLSKEYRKELGEIEQAPFLVYKGLSEETHDVELMRMFVKIAENKDWAISPEEWTNIQQVKSRQHLIPKYENFKPLPVTEKLGPLSGALVDPYIWDDLNQAVKTRSDIVKAYDAVLGLWKTGKVVYNPATQVRNILSNSILADFADLPQHRIDIYARAARDFYTKSGYWKEATENTPLLGKEWAATEAFDFLKATADLKKGSFPVEAAKLIAKHLDKPKELYGFWEQFFKLAVYTNERLNGVAIKPAYKKAEKHIFNYQKIPPAIRWAKRWYSPFITFSYKAVPLFAETAIRKPWKIVKYGLLMAAVEEITRRLMGESEEEVEREKKVLPDYMRKTILPGQLAHLRIPYKDEYGRSKYLDFSYILPWGDVAEQWGQSRLVGRPFLPSHPIWISVGEIAFNEILFTGQDLTIKDLDEGSEYWKRIGTQIWRQAMPSLAGSYSYNKLMAAFKGERDWRGRDRSIEEAIFDVFFGLKVRSIDYNEELDRRVGELERHRDELKKRFKRDYRKIIMNPTPDPDYDMDRQDKLMEKLSNDLDKILNKIYKLQE